MPADAPQDKSSAEYPEDVIVCEFSTGLPWNGPASVRVSPQTGELVFKNCFYRYSPVAITPPRPYRVDEVIAVYGSDSEQMTLVTTGGSVVIPNSASNYQRLCDYLAIAVPENDPRSACRDPLTALSCLLGGITAAAPCVIATASLPRGSLFGSTWGFFAATAAAFCAGALGVYALVFGASRAQRVNLNPFLTLAFGLVHGLCLAVFCLMIPQPLGLLLLIPLALMAAQFVKGVVGTPRDQARRQARSDTS